MAIKIRISVLASERPKMVECDKCDVCSLVGYGRH